MEAAGLPSRRDAIIEGIESVARQHVEDETQSVMQAALGSANDPETRTLGFRYKEMHLPLDVEVYVLGVVGEDAASGAPLARAKGALPHQRQLGGGARRELGTKSRWMLGSRL